MNWIRFYHRGLGVLIAVLAGTAAAWAVAVADAVASAPPRTTADIVRLLDHYRPDPAAAAARRAEADAEPPPELDRDALFRFYWLRGRTAGSIGRSRQEIADLRRAADYGAPGGADHVRVLRQLASAEMQGGNFLNAVKVAEEGWRQTPKDQLGQALAAEQMMTKQFVVLGDFESARKYLREAEASFARLKTSRRWAENGLAWSAQMERGRAEIFQAEGRLIEAEAAYRKALQFMEQHIAQTMQRGDAGAEARQGLDGNLQFRDGMTRSLAGTLLAQGKIVEAEIFCRQALTQALERVGRASTDAAQGLGLLARIIAEQGRSAEAALLAAESLRSYELAGAAPESLNIANARRALAGAYVAQGRYAEAIAVFRALRAGLKTDSELLKRVGSGDLDWVLASLRTGDQPAAEAMAKSLLDNFTRRFGDKSPRTAEARAFHAMTLAARGERQDALALFQAALPLLLDQAQSDTEAEAGTIKRQRRLVTIIESYLRLLGEVDRSGAYIVGAAADESFRLADIARGSAVQRALTASAARATIGDAHLAQLARREQDARQRGNALSELLTQLIGAPPAQQLPQIQAKMREDIASLKAEREDLRREIAAKFPDYAALVDPKPATVAQTARVLQAGEALLAFYFGEESGYVWALRADGKAAFAPVAMSRAELARDVAILRRALDPNVAAIEDIPPFDVAVAHRLFARLLEPVQSLWQDAKVLLVVPHAELGQLPLALLPTAAVAQPARGGIPFAGYKTIPWLLNRVAIAQLPSVTALASLRRLPAGDAARRSFIGFGDPLFSVAQARDAGVQLAATTLATRGRVQLRNSTRAVRADSAGLALLPRLPDTGDEIRDIAKVLGADMAQDVYLQARATEKAVMETDLAHRRVVMFATHGLVPGDLDGLTQPALALTSPAVVSGGGDGFLTMDKVLSLKLDADWVVLSACNTAAGDGAGAEAVSGLGRAFFHAGARALLVSNWPVETVAARLLMTDLFRRQSVAGGMGKAEALRQAMLALMSGPGALDAATGKPDYAYAHPLFWAPFVVVGD